MTEHDVLSPRWGHNVEFTEWREGTCKGWAWLTPGPHPGDILTVRGKKGPIRVHVDTAEWVSNVDDMYSFTGSPA